MPRRKVASLEDMPPVRCATNPNAQEQKMIGYAVDMAEEQLRNRTASPSVVVHYLKLGATDRQLELERMRLENELLKAKTDAIRSQERIEQLYIDAMKSMRVYQGKCDEDDDDFEGDDYE